MDEYERMYLTSLVVWRYFDELWYEGPFGVPMTAAEYFEDIQLYHMHTSEVPFRLQLSTLAKLVTTLN